MKRAGDLMREYQFDKHQIWPLVAKINKSHSSFFFFNYFVFPSAINRINVPEVSLPIEDVSITEAKKVKRLLGLQSI